MPVIEAVSLITAEDGEKEMLSCLEAVLAVKCKRDKSSPLGYLSSAGARRARLFSATNPFSDCRGVTFCPGLHHFSSFQLDDLLYL